MSIVFDYESIAKGVQNWWIPKRPVIEDPLAKFKARIGDKTLNGGSNPDWVECSRLLDCKREHKICYFDVYHQCLKDGECLNGWKDIK